VDEVQSAVIAFLSVSQNKNDAYIPSGAIQSTLANNLPKKTSMSVTMQQFTSTLNSEEKVSGSLKESIIAYNKEISATIILV